MKGLLWKEWVETRSIIVMSALLMTVLFISFVNFNIHVNPSNYKIRTSDFDILFIFFWSIPAALCSVSMIAPEVGSGTLQLLSSVPMTRNRIWWTKMALAVAVLLISDIVTVIVLVACVYVSDNAHLLADGINAFASGAYGACLLGFILSIPIFAFGTVTTTLVDNSVAALVGAVVAAISGFAAMNLIIFVMQSAMTGGAFMAFSIAIPTSMLIALIVVCFISSHQIFKYGESLKTSKRFTLLLNNKVVDILTIVASLFISYAWLVSK